MTGALPTRLDRLLLVAAVILGTLPIALLTSAALARYLPLSDDARFAVGFVVVIPLWVTAMCIALLAKTGLRAFVWCLGTSVVLSALVLPIY
ncbi:MAG: hypothetical protein RL033_2144 [Pseudomonadota bacterium]|jgi:hypothetical protein